MKIIVKELKGIEIEVNVTEETTIAELKKQIEKSLNVPILQQKILFVGKILQDTLKIKDYQNLKDGSKLTLTRVNKPELKKLIHQHFSKYFDSDTATQLTNMFVDNLKKKFEYDYSLDDVERLAETFLLEPVIA